LFYCFLVLVWDLLANSLVQKDVMNGTVLAINKCDLLNLNGRGNPPFPKQGLACKEPVSLCFLISWIT